MFSILIAHYNNAHFFKDCYQSIINQSYQDFEVVILDDSSNDNEVIAVKELIKNDARFKFYQNETNKGVGYTKGKLIELASGDICGFVDPDDTIESNALEIMVKEHLEYPDASIINSNLNFCDEKLNKIKQSKIKQVVNSDLYFFNLNWDISHFVTFKKEFYLKTLGINPYFKIAEDQDLYLKLYEVGNSIQIDNVLYNYRINSKSLTNMVKNEINFYWHGVAVVFAAERRNINVDQIFIENFTNNKFLLETIEVYEKKIDLLKKSRVLKILNYLGISKVYKFL